VVSLALTIGYKQIKYVFDAKLLIHITLTTVIRKRRALPISVPGPSMPSHNGHKYRDDLDNYYDDDDANPGSLMPTEASQTQPEEEQPQAPRPYRCNLKPNVSLFLGIQKNTLNFSIEFEKLIFWMPNTIIDRLLRGIDFFII